MLRTLALAALWWTADGLVAETPFRYSGALRPGAVSPTRPVPAEIVRPEYAASGIPTTGLGSAQIADANSIIALSPAERDHAREAGRLAAEVLAVAGGLARTAGVTTDEIDAAVHAAALARGAYPSPLGYRGFPKVR